MAEQKNYALTIAIPTYNRLEKLKICLKRLMEQKKIEQIEIIVSVIRLLAGVSVSFSSCWQVTKSAAAKINVKRFFIA